MSIESLIATGIQPVQIPSPLAQASQLAQLRNSMNQNELARYTLGKAQQEDVNRNALNAAYQAAYDPQTAGGKKSKKAKKGKSKKAKKSRNNKKSRKNRKNKKTRKMRK